MGYLAKALGLQALSEEPVGDYSPRVSTAPSRSDRAPVTPERAMALPAVWRAVQLISTIGAQLALQAWRNGQPVNPQPALVTKPDPWRSRGSFLERCLVGLATDGNAFLLKHRTADGTLSSVEVLNPFWTSIRWENGRKKYDTARRQRDGHFKTVTYTEADIVHVWGLELPGRDRGLGPIEANRERLLGHIKTGDYANGWFDRGDVPSGILTSDQRLDKTAAAAYKDAWLNPTDADGNPTAGGASVRVLGQGLTYTPIMLKPADAQWLESQAFGVLDIARIFGIPPDYLAAAVDGSSLTYSNLAMIRTQFLGETLFPAYLRKLEDAFTELLPRGQEAKFDTAALLRPDPKTRADIDAIYLEAGVIAPDEVRTREGWTGPAPAKPTPAPAPAAQEVPQ